MTPETTHKTTQQLLALMNSQVEQINSYLELMGKIKQCVIENDVAGLNELVAQNHGQPEDIESNRQQQYELLQTCGYAANESGMRSFIKDSQSTELSELSELLTRQLGKLDNSLLVNGLLINKNQQRVRQSIQILCGHGTSNLPSTYSRQGNLNANQAGTRKLAQA